MSNHFQAESEGETPEIPEKPKTTEVENPPKVRGRPRTGGKIPIEVELTPEEMVSLIPPTRVAKYKRDKALAAGADPNATPKALVAPKPPKERSAAQKANDERLRQLAVARSKKGLEAAAKETEAREAKIKADADEREAKIRADAKSDAEAEAKAKYKVGVSVNRQYVSSLKTPKIKNQHGVDTEDESEMSTDSETRPEKILKKVKRIKESIAAMPAVTEVKPPLPPKAAPTPTDLMRMRIRAMLGVPNS